MSVTYEDAHRAGIERGWSSANYADTYGGDPTDGVQHHGEYSEADGFSDAYREGIALYQNCCWPDGSPRDAS